MEKELEQLGLSAHEAAVYLALIDIGQTGAGEIIKKTGLHRNIVYETLDKLITKKLANKVVVKNVAQFLPTDPKRIITNIKTNLELAEDIVPELAARAKIKQDIIVYQGLEGFRTYNYNAVTSIPAGGIEYVLGAAGDRWYELMGDQYKRYHKLRMKKKIFWKMIVYDDEIKSQELNSAMRLAEVKVISKKLSMPANMQIWEDTVALQMLVEPYMVIEIKNKAYAEAYLNYFHILWEQGQ